MLEKIRALAMEKLASEAEVDAFMAGFEKVALEKSASLAAILGHRDVHQAAIKAGFGLGAGLLGALIVKGVSSTSKAIDHSQLRGKFDMALAQVVSTNKIVKGARPEKVRDYAELPLTPTCLGLSSLTPYWVRASIPRPLRLWWNSKAVTLTTTRRLLWLA